MPSDSVASPGPTRALCRRLPETAGEAGQALTVPAAPHGFPRLPSSASSMRASFRSVPGTTEGAWTAVPHAMSCGPAMEGLRHAGILGMLGQEMFPQAGIGAARSRRPVRKEEHLPVRRLALARLQMLFFCVRAAPCRQQVVAMMHV